MSDSNKKDSQISYGGQALIEGVMIRGKKASEAINLLKFSSRGIAKDISKVLNSAVANAENNHQLDIDILQVTEAYCGKSMVMKRWRPRAKGRPGRINKHLTNVTIKVAEVQNKKLEKEA